MAIKITPYQKNAGGTLDEYKFASTGSIVDLNGYTPYADSELGNIPDIDSTDNVNSATKKLDGKIRKLDNDKADTDHTHNYAGSASAGGAATSAVKLKTATGIDGVQFDGSAAIVHYGTCATNAATAAKTVDCIGFTLVTGSRIAVKFMVTNTASNPTLNVSGTGAKPIFYHNTNIDKSILESGRVYEFIYDGTQYQLVGDLNTDTKYTGSNGITLTGTNFVNSGVRSVGAGTTNGTISVNTNGKNAEVAVAGLKSGAFTDAYVHPTTAGNKHIPAGGAEGQILKFSETGTAVWANESDTKYTGSDGITLTGTNFTNSGVRSISTGTTNGTISVNTNGKNAEVAVAGLKSGAYAAAYTHPTTAGNKHIPSGGSSGQILKYSADGTASWGTLTASDVGAAPSDIDTGVMSVETGTANGTISVDGTDVTVAGLKSGAYAAAYTHPTTAGNRHIPTGGSSGQVLKYGGASGTASWANEYSYTHPASGATAGDYGPSEDVTGTNNTTISVPSITVDANGHVTSISNKTYTSKDTVYTHPTTAGNKHIPTGGSTGQVLKYSASGTASWATLTAADVGAAPSTIDTGVMSVETGTANGTLSVDGTDVAVKGLASGAYAAAYTHPTTAGNKHIPSGGSSGQILKYSADGTATWAAEYSYSHPTTAGNKHIPTGGSTGQVLKYGGSSGTASWATLTASDVGAAPFDINTGVMSVTTGETNGTLSVDGTDVAVKGLASGAYADAYVHPTTAGNKHIPSGGSSGQILKYSSSGTAVWANEYSYTHPTTAGNKHIPTGGATGNVLKYGGSSGTASWGTLTASDVGALASNGTAVRATADASGNNIATTYATKDEVSAIPKFKIEVVTSLPTTGEAATIYLVNTGDESGNLYTEYIYVNDAWEKLGTQTLDLSGYTLKSDITTGSANGTIAVDGTDVAVKGLASGAYANAYVHPTTAGNKHIPSGGSSGQILKYSSSGTAVWANEYSYTHPASGVTADTYGPTANVTGTNNTTLTVPEITVDANGHITGVTERTYTSKDTVYTHPTTAGNKHIPSGGSSGQVLKYSASGTAAWATLTASDVGAAPSTIDTGVMSVTTGSTNGTLSVDGTDVAVKGLASGAYATAYSHPTTSGNKHIPSGGSSGQILKYSADGTAVWAAEYSYTHPTTAGNKHIPSGGSSGQVLKYSASGTAAWATLTASDVGAAPSTIDTGVMSVTTGSTNGTLSVDGTDVAVKGLASGAYATAYSHPNSGATAGSYGPSANASPAHGAGFSVPYVTINAQGHVTAASTKTITLPAQYVHPTGAGNNHIPSGGSSGQFLKWSSSGVAVWAADNNTLNTAGSTDTSSKIFLIGATSQAANPQTYSDDEVYVTSGVLTTKSVQIGGTACTLEYNDTNKCVDFVFA